MDVAVSHRPRSTGAWSGGQLLDIRRTGANAWGVMLGDVGDGSERWRETVRASLLDAAQQVQSPGLVLHAANHAALAAGQDEQAPAAVVFATLEHDRCGAWMTLACAGGPLPTVVRRAGWIDLRGQPGSALGKRESAAYPVDRVGLGPGDAIVLCSRGVAEALDARGERFAEERLPTILLAATGLPAREVADRVISGCAGYQDGPAADDLLVLALRVPDDIAEGDPDARLAAIIGEQSGELPLPGYPVGVPDWSPNERPSPPRQARLGLECEPASPRHARRFVEGVLHSWRMGELFDDDVAIATSELVTNAVRHGGTPFVVIVRYSGVRVRVEVGDGSRELPAPSPTDADALGGRGLAIVEALTAAWGVLETLDGKRVWFEVAAS